MVKKLAVAALALVLLAPMLVLVSIGVLMNPAAGAACTTLGGGLMVGNVPDSLTVTTADGTRFTLNRTQLTHAATVIQVGNGVEGVGRPGIPVALMAALTESTLRSNSPTPAPTPSQRTTRTMATAPIMIRWACSRCARPLAGDRSPS